MLPQIDLDLAQGQDVLGQAVLDQRVVEGIGEGLDPELEGPELGRGFEALHLFGHKGLMATIIPRVNRIVNFLRF